MVGGGVVVVVCVSECMQWWVKCGRRQTVSVDTGSCSGPCFLLTNPTQPILCHQNTFLSSIVTGGLGVLGASLVGHDAII